MLDAGKFELRYRYGTDDETIDPGTEHVPRSVRSFVLDRFEVTWSRFAEFAFAYDDGATRPQEGDGAHPGFPASGWKAAWSESLALVPDSKRALQTMLNRASQPITSPFDNGDVPVRGINWYMAFSFCIWDGGRLPTEAEWAYAAVGGDDGERAYPWTPRDRSVAITAEDARYTNDEESFDEPGPVGAHPSGQSALGQDDLAGNVAEWVADVYQERLEAECQSDQAARIDVHECLQLDGGSLRVQRGGSYQGGPRALRNDARGYGVPDRNDQPIGFRCAKDLPSSQASSDD